MSKRAKVLVAIVIVAGLAFAYTVSPVRREREEQLTGEELEVKMFSDTLDETLNEILDNQSAKTKRPFDWGRDGI